MAEKWDRKWEKPMRSLAADGKVKVDKMFGVYMGDRRYDFDGLMVLPVTHFLGQLFEGEVF